MAAAVLGGFVVGAAIHLYPGAQIQKRIGCWPKCRDARNFTVDLSDSGTTKELRGQLSILLMMVYNPRSICRNGCSGQSRKLKGDPRLRVFREVAYELHKRGHHVYTTPTEAGDRRLPESVYHYKNTKARTNYTRYDPTMVTNREQPHIDLAVLWSNADDYLHLPFPHLVYENGLTKGSIIVDPRGLLGDSFYTKSLEELCGSDYDDNSCRTATLHLQNTSKRPQVLIQDFPRSIISEYIFIATQKFEDVSVQKFSKIGYPELINRTVHCAQNRNIPVVIKIHPHLVGVEREEQATFIRSMQVFYPRVYESNSSIVHLTKNARFSVTLNGGTLFDNMVSETPVLSVARSMFMHTSAVCFDESLHRGLAKMLEIETWPPSRQKKQRQIVCWYQKHSLSVFKTANENIEVLQWHMYMAKIRGRL